MDFARKYILEKFDEHLRRSFEGYCLRHEIESTPSQFLTFLIDQDLIGATNLQRYTVLREYERISEEYDCPKTQMVDTLASRFNISERTIWTMLKHTKQSKK